MEYIKELTQIDFGALLIAVCTVLVVIKYMSELLEWFIVKLGLETNRMREKREEHELLVTTAKNMAELQNKESEDVKQSIRHDEMIRKSVASLEKKVESVAASLEQMRQSQDKDKLAEYKDKIGANYRSYHARKYSDIEPIPYITAMEKEALLGLIAQYESHGGKNSFVHTIVEPELETWKVVK